MGCAENLVNSPQKSENKEKPNQTLLTIDELAAFLRVPKSWVYDKTRVSQRISFPVIRVGIYLPFDLQKVLKWLNER